MDDMSASAPEDGRRPEFARVAAPAPASASDPLFVTVASFDGGYQKHGPCMWEPPAGALPQVGELCVIVRAIEEDGEGEQAVVIAFDRDDSAALDSEAAALAARLDALEAPRPHARQQWSGAVAMVTNVHYAGAAGFGTSSLGLTFTPVFDSTASPYNATDGAILDPSGKLMVPEVGLWAVYARAGFAASATAGPRSVNVRRNNGGTIGGVASGTCGPVGGANTPVAVAADIWPAGPGDYFEVTVYQNIGVNLNLTSVFFSMVKVSEAPMAL
jgi:hypothetical protein